MSHTRSYQAIDDTRYAYAVCSTHALNMDQRLVTIPGQLQVLVTIPDQLQVLVTIPGQLQVLVTIPGQL